MYILHNNTPMLSVISYNFLHFVYLIRHKTVLSCRLSATPSVILYNILFES